MPKHRYFNLKNQTEFTLKLLRMFKINGQILLSNEMVNRKEYHHSQYKIIDPHKIVEWVEGRIVRFKQFYRLKKPTT